VQFWTQDWLSVQYYLGGIYQELEATKNIDRVRRILDELYGENAETIYNLSTGPQSRKANIF
jgi:hypothetical protein